MALMKDYISTESVKDLACRIQNVYPDFPVELFICRIEPELEKLELTERLNLITDVLYLFLPENFETSAGVLMASLGPELTSLDVSGTDLGSSRGFIIISLCTYIARYGQEHLELSLKALYEMTKRFSAEGAIRYFIMNHEERIFQVFHRWIEDDNVHVRRLVSEGLRPRLPWAVRLKKYVEDPRPILVFLEKLRDDSELYVRRSVANNLNDISKDHPDLVIDVLKKWKKNCSSERFWLIKHALRTLVKKGHPGALEILGFCPDVLIKTEDFILENTTIKMGDSLVFSFDIVSHSQKSEPLVVDYIIHHKRANGSHSPCVFKLKILELGAGDRKHICKKHPFRQITTRRYYRGEQRISLQINGKSVGESCFFLDVNTPES